MSKNAVLIALLIIIGLVSISITFYRTIILQDFEAVFIESVEE